MVKTDWRCSAHRQVGPGDRAYLVKQGKPLGIFGRGRISGPAVRKQTEDGGRWYALITFDSSKGDVLWDPTKRLLVNEKELMRMPAAHRFKMMQKSGESLDFRIGHR